jgi:hypothetical protein
MANTHEGQLNNLEFNTSGRYLTGQSFIPSWISFLIHLNLSEAVSQHRIRKTSPYITMDSAAKAEDNRENPEWNRQFAGALVCGVLLLWHAFCMPCLQLLEIGFSAACHPGGLKDIVRSCWQLSDDRHAAPTVVRSRCARRTAQVRN